MKLVHTPKTNHPYKRSTDYQVGGVYALNGGLVGNKMKIRTQYAKFNWFMWKFVQEMIYRKEYQK